ncbi:MAG: DUF551 domain-containing protein [Pasteurellaceae bacterium]|nr:DUF551 domain-containing protein [Pasteurellaceae bacterium]
MNNRHWHNTTDCLPPKGQKVLIFRKEFHETFQAILTSDSPVMWFTGLYYIKGEEVTHWQEIIFPKENEDE